MSRDPNSVRLRSGTIFMDSGAFSLYAKNVLAPKSEVSQAYLETAEKRRGVKTLDKRGKSRWGEGDYSYFSLSKGSKFRAYCDDYARFIHKFAGDDILFANVDVIRHPELTWTVQLYFEQEHGLFPVPIVHVGTPMRYLHRYLESPDKYPLIGIGGMAGGIGDYVSWIDEAFIHTCPASNGYRPTVKLHGFGMTGWKYMVRWPWYSVDSTTWAKYAAYGGIFVPRNVNGFRFDRPPIQINMSRKPTERKQRFHWSNSKSVRQQKGGHYDNAPQAVREQVDAWLRHIGVAMGSFDGDRIAEEGVCSHYAPRVTANLIYFKTLVESLPDWPSPLDPELVQHHTVAYRNGFGFGL